MQLSFKIGYDLFTNGREIISVTNKIDGYEDK